MDTYITIIIVLVVIFAELYIEAFVDDVGRIIRAWQESKDIDSEITTKDFSCGDETIDSKQQVIPPAH